MLPQPIRRVSRAAGTRGGAAAAGPRRAEVRLHASAMRADTADTRIRSEAGYSRRATVGGARGVPHPVVLRARNTAEHRVPGLTVCVHRKAISPAFAGFVVQAQQSVFPAAADEARGEHRVVRGAERPRDVADHLRRECARHRMRGDDRATLRLGERRQDTVEALREERLAHARRANEARVAAVQASPVLRSPLLVRPIHPPDVRRGCPI